LFQIGKLGYLDSLIVSKDFRGKRYSSKLKNAFLDFLKQNNVNICQIHVAAKNKSTMNVYKNWGFAEDEIRMFKKI
jgi:GNAT superfamily N-acetyltransferase